MAEDSSENARRARPKDEHALKDEQIKRLKQKLGTDRPPEPKARHRLRNRDNSTEVQGLSDEWLRVYNERRPHEALGSVPPVHFRPRAVLRHESTTPRYGLLGAGCGRRRSPSDRSAGPPQFGQELAVRPQDRVDQLRCPRNRTGFEDRLPSTARAYVGRAFETSSSVAP
jgi:hypothetical protein